MSETVSTPATNWVSIEVDYRAGIKSVRQIGREHDISHTAINKRAAEEKWVRDLKAKIRAAADAKVAKHEVAREVSNERRLATEAAMVDAGSSLQAGIRLAHRGRIERAQAIVDGLFCELAPVHPPLVVPGDKPPVPLPLAVRADVAKGLTGALRVLVALERQAYGITPDVDGGGDEDADFVTRMLRARERAK